MRWSVFNEIEEIDSRPATLPKNVNTLVTSVLLQQGEVSSLFGKIENLFNRWYTTDFFLKIFFLRQPISRACSKSICGKVGIS